MAERAYAALGRRDEAIQHAKKATELEPLSGEAYGPDAHVIDLARAYAAVGESDRALDEHEYLLSIPTKISKAEIALDPAWDSLRDQPRFHQLLK